MSPKNKQPGAAASIEGDERASGHHGLTRQEITKPVRRKGLWLILTLIVLPVPVNGQSAALFKKGERAAEIAAIEAYAKEVDTFVEKAPGTRRIFANVASGIKQAPDKWREFRSEDERQAAGNGDNLNDNAYVWLKNGKVIAANFTFSSPSGDWVHYVDYYYRRNGTLAKIDAQLNTFYGKLSAIRKRFYNSQGKLLRSTSEYLELAGKKRIKPGRDFIDEPIPFYRTTGNLPFHRMLRKAPRP